MFPEIINGELLGQSQKLKFSPSFEVIALHTPPEWVRVTKSETREGVYYILSGTLGSAQNYFRPNLTAIFFGDNHFLVPTGTQGVTMSVPLSVRDKFV